MFSSVDFPQPDAPTMQTNSPSATSRSIPSMARTGLRRRDVKSLTTFSITSFCGATVVDAVTAAPTGPCGCGASGARGR